MTGHGGGIEAAWYRGDAWLWALRPLELLFRLVSALRRALYRRNLLSTYRAPLPVVVVGNITVGGTGKTPVVIALVEALHARGITAGVVSRGYGATAGEFPHVLTADSDASQCGDEPLLIYRRTATPCVVDPIRARAASTLLERFTVDLLISDDGLQHYALQRDLEIAVVDNVRRLGNGFCLPAGPLREPATRLQSVDHVLYRGSADPEQGVSYKPGAWVNVASGEERGVGAFADADAVCAMAGIGQPQQFFALLQDLGIAFQSRVFADHHAYTRADFAGLESQTILMTEKDAVKCGALAGPDAWYLRIDALLPDKVVDAVAALVHAR
ncbi:tetraacyldisaccharide 4'-kinase [Pseudohalioglobus lutimaris]|uniref:Tetraacyldisaccharide 4'-kinase n=1 Tax=Pseudohalioglobus lutimaris TaxID=1737061 RepID=A0A2N5X4V9_9GAMM|nr:tetraacyldisaccharide 4'-kinase [Pseudohalioglobus lutimaris]PLW69510.1 tetraacyldisaccharide 4'-kinase [Pseudohalioglobus lutimaris]